MTKKYDVFGIGNAIVDILAFVPEEFIVKHSLAKGTMTLMDSKQQASILHDLEQSDLHLASGGSAANTMVAILQSGGNGIYSGKVAADPNGEFYRQDMAEVGIDFDVLPAPETGLPTGTCVVLTTPDAERTMCTHLGVSTSLAPSDVDLEAIKNSKISYVEGYLWDAENPRSACVETMEQSKANDVKVAFTFSDPFLVDRFPDDFKEITEKYCDVLFCNIDEAKMFCSAETMDECAEKLSVDVPLVFITNSEKGCVVVQEGKLTSVPAFPVKAIDTVGAGDAFAGGVLYGLTNGKDPCEAAKWGNYLASEVVKINGPRLSAEIIANLQPVG